MSAEVRILHNDANCEMRRPDETHIVGFQSQKCRRLIQLQQWCFELKQRRHVLSSFTRRHLVDARHTFFCVPFFVFVEEGTFFVVCGTDVIGWLVRRNFHRIFRRPGMRHSVITISLGTPAYPVCRHGCGIVTDALGP
jgi:hypothetical protein